MTVSSPTGVAGSDRVQALSRWLFYGPARLGSGAYLSWVSEEEPGFVYAEAAALAVRAACWQYGLTADDRLRERIIPSLEFLCHCMDDDGLVWHREIGYLFDTVLVLRAFQAAEALSIPGRYTARQEPMTATALDLVARRVAAVGATTDRWSTTFSPHLLKPLAALASGLGAGAKQTEEVLAPAVVQLMDTQDKKGAFCRGPDGRVYLHAHAYALEGLGMLPELPGLDTAPALARGLDYLAEQQRADGSFPRFSRDPDGESSGDVAAQAARLFLTSPQVPRRTAACRALDALSHLIAPSGAVYYSSSARHENVWCSAFALQAFHGAAGGELPPSQLV